MIMNVSPSQVLSATATTATTTAINNNLLSSLANNVNIVGSAWMISSAFFTTYSTTKFLKYNNNNNNNNNERQKDDSGGGGGGGIIVKNNDSRRNIIQLVSTSFSILSRPNLLTLYRFGGSLLLGLLLHPDINLIGRINDTIRYIPNFIVPSLLLFVANFANSISLNRIGISLTYTTKCGIPLMTMILTLLMDGRKALPNRYALASLIPIAVGIGCASWSSPTFELIGFTSSLISLAAQSALNVSSKHAMKRTKIGGPEAQRAMVAVGFVITLAYSLFQITLSSIIQDNNQKGIGNNNNNKHRIQKQQKQKQQQQQNQRIELQKQKQKQQQPSSSYWLVSFMAVFAYHIEYVLSFMFVKLVQPVSYGACDAMRRLCIIVSGHYMFPTGHPFTSINIVGIALALLGALLYSIASH